MARRTDALLPALIGLAGVLIGALVTGGITYLGDRGHRMAEKRTAKRLVASEVRFDTGRLLVVAALGQLPGKAPQSVQWQSQAPALARYVTGPEWSAVSGFYGGLLNLEYSLVKKPCVTLNTWRLAFTVAKSGNSALKALEGQSIPGFPEKLTPGDPCHPVPGS
jgi:hypothetical protein